jgi:hypothetical protein
LKKKYTRVKWDILWEIIQKYRLNDITSILRLIAKFALCIELEELYEEFRERVIKISVYGTNINKKHIAEISK